MVCSCVCVAQTKSAASSGAITGRVVDKAEGVPIRGAFVLVFGESSSKNEVTRVDADGQFQISLLPGDYDVLIGAAGFAPACKRVVVTAGKALRLEPKLEADLDNLEQ